MISPAQHHYGLVTEWQRYLARIEEVGSQNPPLPDSAARVIAIAEQIKTQGANGMPWADEEDK